MLEKYFDTIESQALIIAQAKSWEGTPYQHLGKTKNGGVDCAHFVGMTFYELGMLTKLEDQYYAQDWYLHNNREILLEGIETHFREYGQPTGIKAVCYVYDSNFELFPGDILCMRLANTEVPCHHSAIFLSSNELIHSLEATGVVREQFVNDWVKKTCKIFRIMKES